MLYWNQFPFIRITISFAAGIWFAYVAVPGLFNTLIFWAVSLLIFMGMVFFLKGSLFRRLNAELGLTTLILIFLSGVLSYHMYRYHRQSGFIRHETAGVTGFRAKLLNHQGETEKFDKWTGLITASRDSATWIRSHEKILLYLPQNIDFKPGSILLIQVPIIEIEDPELTYAFNYKAYMERKSIRFMAFAKKDQIMLMDYEQPHLLNYLAHRARDHVGHLLTTYFKGSPAEGILVALLTGKKDQIEESTSNTMRNTGVIHILAVSGLHVGIIFAIIHFIMGPIRKTAAGKWVFLAMMIVILTCFAFIAGLTPSVNRAAIMLSIIQLGKTLNRQSNTLNHVFLSMFILLIVNPYNLFDTGFQLSYAAVLGIVLLYPALERLYLPHNRMISMVYRLMLVSFCAQLSTLPLIIYYFHQFPTYSLVSNLFAIPFAFFMLTMGILSVFLAVSFGLPSILTRLVDIVSEGFLQLMMFLEKLPGSTIYPLSIDFTQALLIAGIVFLIYQILEHRNQYWLTVLLSLVLSFISLDFHAKWQSSRQSTVKTYMEKGRPVAIELIDGMNASLYLGDTSESGGYYMKAINEQCIRERHVPEIFSAKELHARVEGRQFNESFFFQWGNQCYILDEKTFLLSQINLVSQ